MHHMHVVQQSAPYAFGYSIIMRLSIWYVPYACGINTHMVQNIAMYSSCGLYCFKLEYFTMTRSGMLLINGYSCNDCACSPVVAAGAVYCQANKLL